MKLLLIRSGALGDTLMLMPVIKALRDKFEITVTGRKPGIDFLKPFVHRCNDIERGGWYTLFTEDCEDNFIPVEPGTDHVAAFINDPENTVSRNLRKILPAAKVAVYSPFPETGSHVHIAKYMACCLKKSGISLDCQSAFETSIKIPLMKRQNNPPSKVVLHPGSGSKTKNYPLEFWGELLRLFSVKKILPPERIFIMTGPDEEEITSGASQMADRYGAGAVICPEKEDLLSILESTCVYIGHDSGVTHLAAMLGINTIALFRGTSVEQWHPLGPFVKVIKQRAEVGITPGEVLKEANAILNR